MAELKLKTLVEPHGVLLQDGIEILDLLQCPHCGMHFEPFDVNGSRPYCFKHGAAVCGSLECMTCEDVEKKFERVEKGGSWQP